MRIASLSFVLLILSVWMLAAGRTVAGPDDPPQYSEWSAPVNLGAVVNSPPEDMAPFISPDGLSLYIQRPAMAGGYGGWDIWVAQRASVDEPWGAPQNLGPTINSPYNEGNPVVSLDGHRLYFDSNRPGGFGDGDIHVSRRHNKRANFAWQPAENLGPGVNTWADEHRGIPFEDETTGVVTLYFASNRPGLGDHDIYASTLQPDETFGPAVLVEELSSYAADRHPNIRRDGLEFYFMSNRPGSIPNAQGNPSYDVWVSTRTSTAEPWSEPVDVTVVNAPTHDGGPSLSFDGTTLYFFSARPGNVCGAPPPFPCRVDIWMTPRATLKVGE
jgi:hypothetical protein